MEFVEVLFELVTEHAHPVLAEENQCLFFFIVHNCQNKMGLYTVYYFLQTAVHISGDTFTHHQEHMSNVITASDTGRTVLLPSTVVEESEPPQQRTLVIRFEQCQIL